MFFLSILFFVFDGVKRLISSGLLLPYASKFIGRKKS